MCDRRAIGFGTLAGGARACRGRQKFSSGAIGVYTGVVGGGQAPARANTVRRVACLVSLHRPHYAATDLPYAMQGTAGCGSGGQQFA